MTKIIVNIDTFKELFAPVFDNVTETQLNSAYTMVPNIMSVELGTIGLSATVQTNGVYLATAHYLYLRQHPNVMRQLTNASEGDASAGFNNYNAKNPFEYFLSLSPYGLELLTILSQIQPPTPQKPLTREYYWSFLNGFGN